MKALVLCSGGLDSSVLLAMAVKTHGAKNVVALNMFYGQKHAKEQEFAEYQCNLHGVRLITSDMSSVFTFNKDVCALLQGSSKEIDHRTYGEQTADFKEATDTVSAYVPFRNGLFLSYAAAVALQLGASIIYYGAHADDAAGRAYPDCSPEFIDSIDKAIQTGTSYAVRIEAPFWCKNKTDIVAEGIKLGVDFAKTWSCYEGKETPCGECGTCRDRIAALHANNIDDIM